MAKTHSTMLPLGTPAPKFSLQGYVADDCANTVVMFICNHCPYVLHILTKIVEVANRYQSQGIRFVAINANDIEHYPEDSPENMVQLAKQYHFSFPYLYDASQDTAKNYHAACTPDFFVFDDHGLCVYRGRFDAATPGNNHPVTGSDLCAALDHLVAGRPIDPESQYPSLGCNIKWRQNHGA